MQDFVEPAKQHPLRGFRQLLLLGSIVVTGSMLAGCAEYLSRDDRIGFSAGNAKSHNAAVHTIDPWPKHAFRRSMKTPGVRAEAAMQKYRTGSAQGGGAVNFAPKASAGAPGSTGQ